MSRLMTAASFHNPDASLLENGAPSGGVRHARTPAEAHEARARGRAGSPHVRMSAFFSDVRTWLSALLVLAAALMLPAAPAAAQRAQAVDLMIWGGPIYTADRERPRAEAVGVRGDRIVFVGNRAAARRLVGRTTRVVDLRGAAMFPGFTDAHAHLLGIGQRELTLNLEGARSAAEVTQRLREWIRANPGTGTVEGRGWIETGWPEGRFLNRADLDAVSGDRPVLLGRADGHAVVANTAALRAANIDERTPVPAGGEILRGPDGRLTGMLVDDAMPLVDRLRAQPSEAQRRRALDAAFQVEARYGWTGLHNMSVAWEDVLLLERMAAEGRAPLRVYNAVDLEFAEQLFASGPRGGPGDRITTRALKIYADGALGSRGAHLLEAYADAPNTTGLERLPANFIEVLENARAAGIQVATHAIGDGANREVLNAYAQAFGRRCMPRYRSCRPWPASMAASAGQARWRIEHSQILNTADIPRFGRMGVIASMQPSHAIGDLHFAPARLGQERLAGAYAWEALIRSNATVVFGSDAPVERGDPLIEFYAAVARRDLQGRSGPGWHPEQAVTREQALRAFTIDAAYARFAENELGSITVGKRADFSVFSADLMTVPVADIPRARALLTVVDGREVYRADGW